MARGRDQLFRRDGILAFRYKDAAGVWREKSTSKHERVEAREERRRFLDDLAANALPTKMADWRLDEAERWWIEYRNPRISAGTMNSERYRLKHLANVIGNKRLRELTNQDLDNYVTARLSTGIGAWSINKELLLWSLILRKAKLWRRLEDEYKPLPTVASDIGRALTRQQLRHLANVATSNESWEATFYASVLAANTGLRGGEIKKLRLGSLELEKRRLRIDRKHSKTDASARWVELNADAAEAAARLVMRYQEIMRKAGIESSLDHYLLPFHRSRVNHGSAKGMLGYDPLRSQRYWDTAWASLTNEAGLSGLRFHDLRHSFISHMVERGIPLGVVQAIVGHISARMLRHYTHVSTGATRKAVEALDREPMLGPTVCGEICGETAEAPKQPYITH